MVMIPAFSPRELIVREKGMPLAFQSINKGVIPFGFFNIETDLLIMDQYFIFADDFCREMLSIPGHKDQDAKYAAWEIYHIEDRDDIGDFMGAMAGIRHVGFMGELYKLFPFPKREEDFKQHYDGYLKRSNVEPIIGKWSIQKKISVQVGKKNEQIQIGDYLFSKQVFHELLGYVWRGGYPRWKDEIRPEYVTEMKTRLLKSRHPIFSGLSFGV